MVVGQIGESGVVAVSLVAAAFNHARELAPILLLKMVVPLAKEVIYSPKNAITMDAQVTTSG